VYFLFVVALASCGRIGFEIHAGVKSDAGDGDGGVGSDAAQTACVDGDGMCPAGCVGMDSDCVNVCGDGLCVGNAGEKCGACAADCATTSDVCGNGHCDVDESSASCPTDCGPSPWPWDQQGADLVSMLSAMRTGGFTCPGGAMTTVGALSAGPDPKRGADHLAWEIAHQPFFTGLNECDGTTFISDINAAGYSGGAFGQTATAASAIAQIKGDGPTCMRVMMGQYTTASVAMALDVSDAWVIFLK
jgi:hypothetical protein